MKTINWGIIGAGNISSTFATALNGMDNTKLLAVASRNIDRGKDFANRFQIEKTYGSYEDIVKDPDIDVIYIGTPHTEHKSNAELCINNGKAVLCEKPFTINSEETRFLIELAHEKQVFLMEAMWTKFLPVTKQLKSWIAENKIGKVKKVEINFGFQREYDETKRLYNINLGGGALLDVGVYPITYAIHIMNQLPNQVLTTALFGANGIDVQNSVVFRFDETIAMLSSGITANVGKDAIIIGETGKIVVPNFWMANEMNLYNNEGELVISFKEDKRINGYEFEAEEVNNCIRAGKVESDVIPLDDTLKIIEIMDSIRSEWGLKYKQES
jgi:predicted dehydrogenase